MKVAMIAAMANGRVIGKDNAMPWHLPADLKFFKKATLGKPVIMGRKTFESIGRPLPKRHNIVITRDKNYQAQGVDVVHSKAEALSMAGDVDEVVIIGGGNIYQQFMSQVDELYLTFIDLDVEGDAHFPDYNEYGQWEQVWQQAHSKAQGEPYDYQFARFIKQAD